MERGKTTLIKTVLNFIAADSGTLDYGKDGFHQFVRKLGYLPERPYFHSQLTGREFVTYMSLLNEVQRNIAKSKMSYWAEKLEIADVLDRKLKSYSKGMLQRLGIVSCLIHEPEILIFDEPVSGLDPIGRKTVKNLMVELHREGRTIFLVAILSLT